MNVRPILLAESLGGVFRYSLARCVLVSKTRMESLNYRSPVPRSVTVPHPTVSPNYGSPGVLGRAEGRLWQFDSLSSLTSMTTFTPHLRFIRCRHRHYCFHYFDQTIIFDHHVKRLGAA